MSSSQHLNIERPGCRFRCFSTIALHRCKILLSVKQHYVYASNLPCNPAADAALQPMISAPRACLPTWLLLRRSVFLTDTDMEPFLGLPQTNTHRGASRQASYTQKKQRTHVINRVNITCPSAHAPLRRTALRAPILSAVVFAVRWSVAGYGLSGIS